MQVERQFIEVKQRQVVIELPESFINHRVEVIALTVDEDEAEAPGRMPQMIVLDSHIWFWWINLEHHRMPTFHAG